MYICKHNCVLGCGNVNLNSVNKTNKILKVNILNESVIYFVLFYSLRNKTKGFVSPHIYTYILTCVSSFKSMYRHSNTYYCYIFVADIQKRTYIRDDVNDVWRDAVASYWVYLAECYVGWKIFCFFIGLWLCLFNLHLQSACWICLDSSSTISPSLHIPHRLTFTHKNIFF